MCCISITLASSLKHINMLLEGRINSFYTIMKFSFIYLTLPLFPSTFFPFLRIWCFGCAAVYTKISLLNCTKTWKYDFLYVNHHHHHHHNFRSKICCNISTQGNIFVHTCKKKTLTFSHFQWLINFLYITKNMTRATVLKNTEGI